MTTSVDSSWSTRRTVISVVITTISALVSFHFARTDSVCLRFICAAECLSGTDTTNPISFFPFLSLSLSLSHRISPAHSFHVCAYIYNHLCLPVRLLSHFLIYSLPALFKIESRQTRTALEQRRRIQQEWFLFSTISVFVSALFERPISSGQRRRMYVDL